MSGYIAECPECGHRFESCSVTGSTRCGRCRRSFYVPADERPASYVDVANARVRRRRDRRGAIRRQRRTARAEGYPVRCVNPECGIEFRSRSVSGRTRCGECGTAAYVSVDERPAAYVAEWNARRRQAPRPMPVTVPDRHLPWDPQPRVRAPRPPSPMEVGRARLDRLLRDRRQLARRTTQPLPPPGMARSAHFTRTEAAVQVRRLPGPPTGGAYWVVEPCGHPLIVPYVSQTPPAEVRCPQHGIVDVHGGPVRMEPTAWLPHDGVPAEFVESSAEPNSDP